MTPEKTRQQFAFIAGASALVMGGLLVFYYPAYHMVGADVYGEDFGNVVLAVSEHKRLFEATALAQCLSMLCLLPIGLAFVYIFDADRPYAILAACLLAVGGVLIVDAYGHYANLIGTSLDYVNGLAPPKMIIEQADIQGDQFQIIQYGGLVAFGLSMVIVSILMARSEYFPRPISWLTFGLGIVSFCFTAMPILLVLTQLVWCFTTGGFLLVAESRFSQDEPETALGEG